MIRTASFPLTLVLVAALFSLSLFSQEKTFLRKVVIDAGHGGKDPGTIGRKTREKDVALAIALKVGRQIEKSCEDVKVIFTRETDVFVELFQRAEIANRSKADLFISIHCNANPSHIFQGSETYVMGLHKSQQNLEISKLENASILMEPDYLVNYNGFDPNSAESYITFSLFQNAFLNQSMEFASLVQNELKAKAGMEDRGVRQAGFLVLYKTTMPSVLIETGFLSNPDEESFLLSNNGQDHIADAICRAFIIYKQKVEKPIPPDVEKGTPISEKNEETSAKIEANNRVDSKPATVKKTTEQIIKAKPVQSESKVRFCVQIAVYPTDIGLNNKKFKGLPEVSVYKHQSLYKYTVGNEKEVASATALMEEIRKKGFTDAFVVAFNGEERITIAQAKQLLNQQKIK